MPSSVRAALALTLCLGAVTACSSSADPEAPKVVSFRSGPATTGSAPPSTASGRPVLRVDMTDREEDDLMQVYYVCLVDHGVAMKQNAEGRWEWAGAESKMASDRPEMVKACDNKIPDQPPEMNPEQNPYYEQDNNNYFQCLEDHGDDVHKDADGWNTGPKWGDFPNAAAVTEACEVQAFDGKKG
jgi:hypothetical protein